MHDSLKKTLQRDTARPPAFSTQAGGHRFWERKMTNITRRSALGIMSTGMATLGLAACGGSSDSGSTSTDSADKTYRIGVLQLVEHEALDAANEGFVAALDESGITYEIDQQNAQGDQSACQTIAAKLVGDGDDLILAIATPAVEACAGATEEIPIVGTAVTDFAASNLVESNDAPGGNITGSSDLTPVADQIRMLHTVLPDAKEIGVLWCTAESNSDLQAAMAADACKEYGMTATDYTVSSSNEIQSVVESMIGKVDALYAPTDNTIAASAALVCSTATENNIPVIAGEEGICAGCGVATLSIRYYDLGYTTGEMAYEILVNGADVSAMEIRIAPRVTKEYNAELCAVLNIAIPEDYPVLAFIIFFVLFFHCSEQRIQHGFHCRDPFAMRIGFNCFPCAKLAVFHQYASSKS